MYIFAFPSLLRHKNCLNTYSLLNLQKWWVNQRKTADFWLISYVIIISLLVSLRFGISYLFYY